jgi:hypothetical protein
MTQDVAERIGAMREEVFAIREQVVESPVPRKLRRDLAQDRDTRID